MISAIVLSYNTCDLTLKCLSALEKSKDVELEIIVVDNASTDDSVSKIKKSFPKVKLIANKDNIGFAAGNNQAMKLAKGDHFLLLNSDCFVQPTTISDCMEKNVDVVGCQLLNSDSSIQPSWGYFVNLRRVVMLMTFFDNLPIIRKFADSIHVRDLGRYQTFQEVDWVMGAFVLLKREVFEKTQGFDEKYFMYGEEMEWMYRIKQFGFKIFYNPSAQATHLQGSSTKSLEKMLSSEAEGYIYWFSKHNSSFEGLILRLILIKGFLFKSICWFCVGKISKAQDNFKTFLKISGLSKK